MKNVVFYVSGHGYGHAVRTAEIIRAFSELAPDVNIIVRTTAPKWIFNRDNNPKISIQESMLDPGVVEATPLEIDYSKTIDRLTGFLKTSLQVVSRETAFAYQNKISAIVSDIPSLAGEISERIGAPCIAASNFLWDWIYEPMIEDEEYRNAVLLSLRAGYSKMALWMRFPFGHSSNMPAKVVDVPLVVQQCRFNAQEIREMLGISPKESRPLVYIAMSRGYDMALVAKAAQLNKEFLFLLAEQSTDGLPENVKSVLLPQGASYADLINAADVVVGKPGYGLVSICVAYRKRLLYPQRRGFREDEILLKEIGNYTPAMKIGAEDYNAGNWGEYISRLLVQQTSDTPMATDGARVCAGIIKRFIS